MSLPKAENNGVYPKWGFDVNRKDGNFDADLILDMKMALESALLR